MVLISPKRRRDTDFYIPLHDLSNRFRLPLDKQVNVVRHQAVGVKKKSQAFLLLRQQREKLPPVIARMKDVLPVVPSRDQR